MRSTSHRIAHPQPCRSGLALVALSKVLGQPGRAGAALRPGSESLTQHHFGAGTGASSPLESQLCHV